MDQTSLIKRAFRITLRNRVLWLFGILVTLSAGASGFSGGGGGGSGGGGGGGIPGAQPGRFPYFGFIPDFNPGNWIGFILLCCCILVILVIAALILQYVARGALYRSADQIAETGVAPSWREGFRLGWSRRSARLFLLELLVGLAGGVLAMVLLAVAASPLLLLLARNNTLSVIGVGLAILLGLVWLLMMLVAAVILSVAGQFWAREVVLEDRSIGVAIVSGWELVRTRARDLGILWLLMAAIAIGMLVVSLIVLAILAIPSSVVIAGMGWALASAGESLALGVTLVAIGIVAILFVVGLPLIFVNGIFEAFTSTTWTLAYREVAARGTAAMPEQPTLEEPAAEAPVELPAEEFPAADTAGAADAPVDVSD